MESSQKQRGAHLLPESDWDAIKVAACAGVPYKSLAIQYGLIKDGKPDTNAIRQRAWREKWPIQRRIVESAKRKRRDVVREVAKMESGMTPHNNNSITNPTKSMGKVGFSARESNENATVMIVDDLLANGIRGTLAAQKIALRSILHAPDSLAVTSPADLQSLLKTVRIASGQDKDGTNVNVVIGNNWSDWPEPVSQEIDVTPVSTDLADY